MLGLLELSCLWRRENDASVLCVRRRVLLVFLMLAIWILTGCASKSSNNSLKLLANIETHLKKERGVEHGAVVAAYDLGGLGNARCLHAKDYGMIVNDDNHNRHFIKKVLSKCQKGALERRARAKITALKRSLAKLHDKYMILGSADIRRLDLDEDEDGGGGTIFDNMNDDRDIKSVHYIKELHEIDKIARQIPMFFPIYSARLTSNFGMRKHPVRGGQKFHYGTDFAGMKASRIYAAAYGKVISVERVNGYGNTIVIDHGKQFRTRYAHLSKVLVNIGEQVIRGQEIGLQGKTGEVTSEHLHFEILFKGQHINPIDFVADGHSCSLR